LQAKCVVNKACSHGHPCLTVTKVA